LKRAGFAETPRLQVVALEAAAHAAGAWDSPPLAVCSDMPLLAYQAILPVLGIVLLALVAATRRRVRRLIGRDPVVCHAFQDDRSPEGFLESVMAVGSVAAVADAVLNALATEWVEDSIAVPILRRAPGLGWIGLGLLVSGIALYAAAVHQLGPSWRIGIDHARPGPLRTGRLYGHVRHPVYVSAMLVMAGQAALTADVLSIGVAITGAIALGVQARIEEAFLRSRYPDEFAAYEKRTGRFWPRRGAGAP